MSRMQVSWRNCHLTYTIPAFAKGAIGWGTRVKKCSNPTPNTIAMRIRVGNVRNSFPRSSLESIAGERPVCLPSSTNPMLFRSAGCGVSLARVWCKRSANEPHATSLSRLRPRLQPNRILLTFIGHGCAHFDGRSSRDSVGPTTPDAVRTFDVSSQINNKPFERRKQLISDRKMIVQNAATEQEHSMSDDPRNKRGPGNSASRQRSAIWPATGKQSPKTTFAGRSGC